MKEPKTPNSSSKNTINQDERPRVLSSEAKIILARKHAEKELAKELVSILLSAAIAIVLCRFVFALHKIPSGSMEPTIKTHSIAVCWRFPYLIGDPAPKHGDIVSFFDPDNTDRVLLIKRVIGLPGDTISFDGKGNVYRNGHQLVETYIAEENSSFAPAINYEVPDGYMFVMGDNRYHSNDSRFKTTTFIPIENIYSKELFSFYAPHLSSY